MICGHCQAQDLPLEELWFARQADGRWEMRCPHCAAGEKPPPPGRLDWLRPPTPVTPLEFRHLIGELRAAAARGQVAAPAAADEDAKKAAPPTEQRAYERYRVRMGVRYRLPGTPAPIPGDDAGWLEGEVFDLSKGGVGFVTDRAIDPGMRVKVWIESRNPKQTSVTFRGDVEVRRCRPAAGGRFWIGAKFMGPGAGGGRRNARQNVVFNLWYQLAEGAEVRRGTLVDISRGGLAMLVMEPLEVGATLAVCVRGDSGAFRDQEIRALVRVVRCVCVYAGNYEVGTEFLRAKVSPHAAGDAVAPDDLHLA